MKLVCISDTHGAHEDLVLPSGDVLIHAGDFTAHGKLTEAREFMHWAGAQHFKHVLCVAGNHDTCLEQDPQLALEFAKESGVSYLNDTGIEIEGRLFWGSPITPRFHNWAFMRDPGEDIEAHWRMIPDNTDVLITHGPPYGVMDSVQRQNGESEHTGCPSLLARVLQLKPRLHLFGHIHEGRGCEEISGVVYRNVSSMNEHYRLVNEPVVHDL